MVPVRSRGIYPVYDLEMITENPRSAPVCVCPAEYLCKKSIHPGNLYVPEPGRLVIVKTYIAPTHQRRCGKVMFFSRAYLFTVGSVVTITHGVLSLIIQGPPHPPLSPGHRPSHLYTEPPTPDMFKSVHYEARTVGKWAVGIILECLLVTARKRSLRRLCFHKSVSFWPRDGEGGGLHPRRNLHPGGSAYKGVCI